MTRSRSTRPGCRSDGADRVAITRTASTAFSPWSLYEKLRTPILVDGRRVTHPDTFANSPVRRVAVGEPWPWAAHPPTREERERTPEVSEFVGG
jgi:hypothetical protein